MIDSWKISKIFAYNLDEEIRHTSERKHLMSYPKQ